MKAIIQYFSLFISVIFTIGNCIAQEMLEVTQSDALIKSPNDLSLSIISNTSGQKAYVALGDESIPKSSVGFQDVLKFSLSSDIATPGFSINSLGYFGANSLPSSSRYFIRHNSTSGLNGSPHLELQDSTANSSRIKFSNASNSGHWNLEAIVSDSSSFGFRFLETSKDTEIMRLTGYNYSAGIHQSIPLGNFHIRQLSAGVDALAFEEPNSQGSDKWGFRVGSEDILIYFNSGIRGGFDVSTGNYNNFPPSSSAKITKQKQPWNVSELKLIMNENHIKIDNATVNPSNDFIVNHSKHGVIGIDYNLLKIRIFETLASQQRLIDKQAGSIASKIKELHELRDKIKYLEQI